MHVLLEAWNVATYIVNGTFTIRKCKHMYSYPSSTYMQTTNMTLSGDKLSGDKLLNRGFLVIESCLFLFDNILSVNHLTTFGYTFGFQNIGQS
jgi:hypothetical protein